MKYPSNLWGFSVITSITQHTTIYLSWGFHHPLFFLGEHPASLEETLIFSGSPSAVLITNFTAWILDAAMLIWRIIWYQGTNKNTSAKDFLHIPPRPPKGKSPFPIGNSSSNGVFFPCHVSFRGGGRVEFGTLVKTRGDFASVSPFHLYIFLMEELQFCTSFKSIELSRKGLHMVFDEIWANLPWVILASKCIAECIGISLFFHVLVSCSSLPMHPLSHLPWSLMEIVPSNIGNVKSI